MGYSYDFDLSSKEKFKEEIYVDSTTSEHVQINMENDVPGQIDVKGSGKDIIVTAYALDKKGNVSKKVLGTVTIINGADSASFNDDNCISVSSNYWNSDDLFNTWYTVGDWESKKAQTLKGTDLNEEIYGGTKADKIFTGGGNDYIEGGKGNDTITINGAGEKEIALYKGDGNDVVTVDPLFRREADVSIYVPTTYVSDSTIALKKAWVPEPQFTFKKEFQDLTITATYQDGTTDSIKLEKYFDIAGIVKGAYDDVDLNNTYLDNIFSGFKYDEHIEVGGVKVGDLLKNTKLIDVMSIGMKATSSIDPSKTSIGDYLSKYMGISIPSGLKSVNAFVGTQYNDSFTGTTNKDLMISFGGNNEFVTGTKGQTVIASLNNNKSELYAIAAKTEKLPILIPKETDSYEVSSFTAGTAIIDMDGEYDMEIKGVDTNDIHMLATNIRSEDTYDEPILYFTGSVSTTQTTDLTYLTDSKGVKNFEGLNYKDIAGKVLDIVNPGWDSKKDSSSDKERIKAINSAINTASGLIDKFRGVAVVAQHELYPDEYKHFEDIYVTDNTKEQNTHVISAESQKASDKMTAENFSKLFNYACEKYGFGSGMKKMAIYNPGMNTNMLLSMGQFLIDIERYTIDGDDARYDVEHGYLAENILKSYYKYDKKNDVYTLNDKAYKEIKSYIFDTFGESFVGTNLDNTYTIKNSLLGTAIASGAGSDTFNFKGDLINKLETNTYRGVFMPLEKGSIKPAEYDDNFNMGMQTYNIVSEIGSDTMDNINISNYSFDKNTLYMRPSEIRMNSYGDVYFDGLSLQAYDAKKGNYASINYGIGDEYHDNYGMKLLYSDFDDGYYLENGEKFDNLTITDGSKKTFNVTAEYNSGNLTYDWAFGTNNIAITNAKNTTIYSSDGTNIINAGSFAEGVNSDGDFDYDSSLSYYNYGGNDVVNSTNYYSNDNYTVYHFNKNTKLSIYDEGGNDRLNLSAEDNTSLRLFFDVDADGDYSDNLSIVTSDNLKKGNFVLSKYDGAYSKTYYNAMADKGVSFEADEIENVYINGSKASIESTMNQIAGEVADWLNSDANKKGYYSAAEVLNNGSAKEINQILAIYNDANINIA